MNIVFFGSGIGSGHAIHAASVFFAFRRAGIKTRFILISDGEFGRLVEPYFELIKVNMQPQLFLKQDRETEIYMLLKNLDIDFLIVYGIWMPLFPILDDFSFKKIILFRQYEDWWFRLVTKKHGELAFNPDQYDCTISVEPNFSREGWLSINPLIIRNRDEILDREKAREALVAETGRRICVLAHNGRKGELAEIETQIEDFRQKYQMIVTSNRNKQSLFPLADYYNGIDFIIGGAGYNLFYETRFFNIDASFLPQKRKNEDQRWRVITNNTYKFTQNGSDQLVEIMRNL